MKALSCQFCVIDDILASEVRPDERSIIMSRNKKYEQLTEHWNNDMPFNQLLGLKIVNLDVNKAEVRFLWNEQLVGNPAQKILHGGVTASALDLAGGAVAAASMIEQLTDHSPSAIRECLSKLGTIDLRTDYLRPGRGEEFVVTAHIIRRGRKVTVARMEMHNEIGDHIAFGTGTYLVG